MFTPRRADHDGLSAGCSGRSGSRGSGSTGGASTRSAGSLRRPRSSSQPTSCRCTASGRPAPGPGRPPRRVDQHRLGLPAAEPAVRADQLLERGDLLGARVDRLTSTRSPTCATPWCASRSRAACGPYARQRVLALDVPVAQPVLPAGAEHDRPVGRVAPPRARSPGCRPARRPARGWARLDLLEGQPAGVAGQVDHARLPGRDGDHARPRWSAGRRGGAGGRPSARRRAGPARRGTPSSSTLTRPRPRLAGRSPRRLRRRRPAAPRRPRASRRSAAGTSRPGSGRGRRAPRCGTARRASRRAVQRAEHPVEALQRLQRLRARPARRGGRSRRSRRSRRRSTGAPRSSARRSATTLRSRSSTLVTARSTTYAPVRGHPRLDVRRRCRRAWCSSLSISPTDSTIARAKP